MIFASALQDAYYRLIEDPKFINEVEVRNTIIAAANLAGDVLSEVRSVKLKKRCTGKTDKRGIR
jgi:hypothetical protein